MDKAQSFRDHIPTHVPELKQNPDKFSVFIGNGNVVARNGSASFEYRYEIQALITDYPHHPDTIFLPLILWVAVNQPSLLQNPDKAENEIKFEAEPINNKDYDIHITFPVTEAVIAALVDGKYQMTHIPEPTLPDLGGPTPWQLMAEHQPQNG